MNVMKALLSYLTWPATAAVDHPVGCGMLKCIVPGTLACLAKKIMTLRTYLYV